MSRLGDRNFVDAVLFRAQTGVPWRDLPERFGPWKTVYNKFAMWSHRGYWERIFRALQLDVADDGVIIDASVVRAHQDAAGGKGGSTAMHWGVLEVDSPRRFTLSPTRRAARSTSKSRRDSSTSRAVAESIVREHGRGNELIADTGYESGAIRACAKKAGLKPVIHPHPRRRKKSPLDRGAYRKRYLVEVFFHNLKRFRGLATRFEKTAKHYLAHLHVACIKVWLNDILPAS